MFLINHKISFFFFVLFFGCSLFFSMMGSTHHHHRRPLNNNNNTTLALLLLLLVVLMPKIEARSNHSLSLDSLLLPYNRQQQHYFWSSVWVMAAVLLGCVPYVLFLVASRLCHRDSYVDNNGNDGGGGCVLELEQVVIDKVSPTVPKKEKGGRRAVKECAVCLSVFKVQESLGLLPKCGHVFHEGCIDNWLTRDHSTCPVCRAGLAALGFVYFRVKLKPGVTPN